MEVFSTPIPKIEDTEYITDIPYRSQPPTAIRCAYKALSSLILLTTPTVVLAHGGHGDEFQGGTEATQAASLIQVDATTANQLGIKVEPVAHQRLEIKTKTHYPLARITTPSSPERLSSPAKPNK